MQAAAINVEEGDMEVVDADALDADALDAEEGGGGEGASSSSSLAAAVHTCSTSNISSSSSGSDDIEAPNFDLEAYAARYVGHTKVRRLLFIASRCKARELDAYRLALDTLKERGSMNVELYRKVVGLVAGRLGPAYQLDSAWADGLEKQAAAQKERLESDLQSSRTILAKESIRLGYQDLGEFYYARGDLDNALKNFVRTRDYCSMTRHSVDMCLNVIKVSVGLDSFSHVNTYVSKAEHTPDLNDPKARHKLKAAAGLVQLSQQHYANAARKFLECGVSGLSKDKPSDMSPAPFAQVLAAEDVAVYGGLCALASLDRAELRRRVVDNMAFKGLLDLVPSMRELIYDFCSSKYGRCLRVLGAMKGELMLDLHLARHVRVLYQQIRERCLLQFFTPYLSVDLARMSEAFGTPVGELEKEVADLIMRNRLPARVDSQKKTLHRRQVDPREEGYKKVFGMGKDFLREVRAMLLRASLVEHGVCVEGGGGGGREGGRRGLMAGGHLSQPHSMGMMGGLGGGGRMGGGREGRMEGESSAEEEEEGEEGDDLMEEGDGRHGFGEGLGGANMQDPDMYVGNN